MVTKGDVQRSPVRWGLGATPHAPPEAMRAYRNARDRLLRAVAIDQTLHAEYRKKLDAQRARGYPVPPYEAGNAEVYQLLSMAQLRVGDVPQAVQAARRALELLPAGAEGFRSGLRRAGYGRASGGGGGSVV